MLIPTIGNNTYRDNYQLGLGNDSLAVRYLQYALNGCYYAGLALDGIYGPQTRDHILWYDTFGDCARL